MRRRVTGKQPNSRMCFVCGLENDGGLQASFHELENGELMAVFTPGENLQSYPGRLHGGIVSAILDETIGRAVMMGRAESYWGVTIEITVRFRKPVPLDRELRVIGRITRDGKRVFEGSGEVLLPDGSVAAEGFGRYMKLPLEKIADFKPEEQNWRVTPLPDDPRFIELGPEDGDRDGG
ncbi:MAG: PaaI family thioesterase [Desulfobulbaceae bacterium]